MHFRELNLWGKSVFCIWWNCGGKIKTKGKMRTGAVSWRAWLLIVLFYGRCYFLNTTWNKCSFMDSPPKYDSSWSEKKVKLFIVSKSVAWGYFAQMNVQSSMVSLEHSITLLRTPRSKITCIHTAWKIAKHKAQLNALSGFDSLNAPPWPFCCSAESL